MSTSPAMAFDTGTWWLIGILVTALIGAITFLIKRTLFSRVDDIARTVKEVQETAVRKEDYTKSLDKVETDIRQIRKDYTPRDTHVKDFDEVRSDIKKIAENYLTKEDFFREQAKTDRKLDQIINILLKKGES
ncbi:hypothetical protein AALB39_18060 [Lachnospiraceae bacterium 54-53]